MEVLSEGLGSLEAVLEQAGYISSTVNRQLFWGPRNLCTGSFLLNLYVALSFARDHFPSIRQFKGPTFAFQGTGGEI